MAMRKILLICVFIITVLFAIILRSPISVMPLIFVSLSVLFSFLYILIIWKSCEVIVDTKSIKKYERLSSVNYFVGIINKGFLVFSHISFKMELESIDGFAIEVYEYNFTLGPKEDKALEITMELPHIGRYIVKITELKIYGFFDIFYLKTKPKWKEELLVTPKIYNIEDFEINTSNPVFTVNFNAPHKIKGGEFDDIREYMPGDPIKNIHWKLSAHANKYMTRIMNSDAISGVSIYMDFSINQDFNFLEAASINDSLIESAYSIALYTFDKNYGVNFIYSESNSPVYVFPKTYDELDEFIYSLPRVSLKEKYSIELLVAEYSNTRASLDNIVVLTSNINIELINALTDCKERGKYPLLCYLRLDNEKVNIPDSIKNLLSQAEIAYYIMDSAKEISSMLGGYR